MLAAGISVEVAHTTAMAAVSSAGTTLAVMAAVHSATLLSARADVDTMHMQVL